MTSSNFSTSQMLSPALSLPPEILGEILWEVALDAHTAYVERLKEDLFLTNAIAQRPYSWIRLSHVCRAWRSVAVSTPSLWADISVINVSATQEFLKRAEKRNLTVAFQQPGPFPSGSYTSEDIDARREAYTNILHNHIQRITSLIGPSLTTILSSVVAKAATQLRAITMITSDRALEASDRDALPLPFPVLEHFEYRVASFSWQPYRRLLCPTLRFLVLQPNMGSVHFAHTSRVYLPTARELVRAIATMPRLEHLDVRISATREHPAQTAELRSLRHICLIGASASVVAPLLASIIPAPDVRLRLDCNRAYGVGASQSLSGAIATALEAHGSPFPLMPCTAFWIGDIDPGYCLLGWRDAPRLADFADFGQARAGADIRVTCFWTGTHENFAAIFLPFTLHAVLHVRVGRLPWNHYPVLQNVATLCSSRSLQTLVLDDVVVTRTLYLLEQTSAKDVTLMYINFKPSDPAKQAVWLHSRLSVQTRVSPDERSSPEDLAKILAKRVAEGRPITSLRIVCGRNIAADDIEVLREHVAEVEWDGLELGSLEPGQTY
ncbi:F-box protein [Phanerochaete sordida]|uniref:F-box protein n=1 Tax=Phanerochaete sordida TaxID=48140 RepID=A0A9P3GP57_9APHY|nr:F-box protein [Phanerochaete sordida]